MKSTLRWVLAGVALALLGMLAWHFYFAPRDRRANYDNVARLLCVRFAADAIAKTLPLGKRIVVISTSADERLAEAALARDRAVSMSRDKSVPEQRYVADVSRILTTEAPALLALCQKLPPVYVACEEHGKDAARFRGCIEEKQRPIVTEIASWLLRNVPR